jgi:hypothetical protein
MRRWKKAGLFFMAGVLMAIMGFGMLLIPRVVEWPLSRTHVLTYIWDMLSFLVLGSSFLLFRRGKRHLALSAEDIREKDSRAPILFLRSFGDEKKSTVGMGYSLSPWGSNKTFEELIVEYMANYGPVLAIGRPGEKLPPLGAAREYIDHDSWQRTVKDLISESQLIVLLAGGTEGLLWELQTIAELNALNKLMIVLPQMDMRLERWRAIRHGLEQVGDLELPDDQEVANRGLVLGFSESGRPHLFAGKPTVASAYREALGEAVALVAKSKGEGE